MTAMTNAKKQQTRPFGAWVTRATALISLGIGLGGTGTASGAERPVALDCTDASIAGRVMTLTPAPAETPARAVLEIRRISGLTWDELATLFSVSRRSVHHWASGKQVSSANEHHIRRTLGVVRALDRGASSATRNLILGQHLSGSLIFDLLQAQAYEDVLDRALSLPATDRRPSRVLSNEETRRRRPSPPIELLAPEESTLHLQGKHLQGRFKRAPKKA
ncbi:MAG: hypothetical protein AB7G40_18700 [Hyphomonadaceae bacterium]